MDVMLKREYEQGWISNYEVGGGTTLKAPVDERWMARLFALRYTNHSSIGIYAAANNTNDGATPGDKGEWTRKDATSGEKKSYLAGVTFFASTQKQKIAVQYFAESAARGGIVRKQHHRRDVLQ